MSENICTFCGGLGVVKGVKNEVIETLPDGEYELEYLIEEYGEYELCECISMN